MLVEVIVNGVPYVGKRGEIKDLPEPEANVLILLKQVRRAYSKTPPPFPQKSARKKATRKKKTYKRRDVTNSPQKVVMTPEVSPVQWSDNLARSDEPGTE